MQKWHISALFGIVLSVAGGACAAYYLEVGAALNESITLVIIGIVVTILSFTVFRSLEHVPTTPGHEETPRQLLGAVVGFICVGLGFIALGILQFIWFYKDPILDAQGLVVGAAVMIGGLFFCILSVNNLYKARNLRKVAEPSEVSSEQSTQKCALGDGNFEDTTGWI